MEDSNRVTDKVIRRVSSRSRRIALRARRETGSSSSESEQDTQSPKLLRKSGSNDHNKALTCSSNSNNSAKVPQQKYALTSNQRIDLLQQRDNFRLLSALIGICHLNISFFHLWLAASIYNLQKNFLLLTRTLRQLPNAQQRHNSAAVKSLSMLNNSSKRQQQLAENSDEASARRDTGNQCKSLLLLNASPQRVVQNSKQTNEGGSSNSYADGYNLPSQPPSSSVLSSSSAVQLSSSSGRQKLNGYVDDLNTCESEDADYVSDDHSTYSRPNKSTTELDVSMDESLAESSGRESGYLSGIDVSFLNRSCTSSTSPPTVSPQTVTSLSQHSSGGGSSCGTSSGVHTSEIFRLRLLKPDADDENNNNNSKTSSIQIATKIPSSTSTSSLASVILSPKSPPFLLSSKSARKYIDIDDSAVPDFATTAKLLKNSVVETKYVTAIFEMTVGGIDELIADVNNELKTWFNSELGLMGIACEIQWSVPEKYRNRLLEMRMKSALHASLRENNLRVLNLKNNTGVYLPLTLAAAVTQENCGRDQKLKSFQGIYRRFYESLLPYQHKETGECHASYWKLDTNRLGSVPTPKPQQFIFGSNPTELDRGSLIALNVIALKIVNERGERSSVRSVR